MLKRLSTLALAAAALAVAGWRQASDIDTLAATLRTRHPKLLLPGPRAAFDSAVSATRAALRNADRAHEVAALARLAASLHDAHTKVLVSGYRDAPFRAAPIRVYLFEEGVYVIRSDSAHAHLLGARVDSVGRMPIAAALSALRPYVHSENESGFKDIAAARLILPGLMNVVGAGGTADSLSLSVRLAAGQQVRVSLGAPANADAPAPRALTERLSPLPLYLRDPAKPYWFTQVDSASIFWIQFNSVENAADESLAAFAARAMDAAEASSARYLVIDARRNNGGDNTLLRPLLIRLIRSRFNAPGRLYAVTGRLTFSAAVNFIARLRSYSDVILVGEPTAAPANHYGETNRLDLPNTRAILLYSSLWWQDADPRDSSTAIVPVISAPPNFGDYREGRDPALAAIIDATRRRGGSKGTPVAANHVQGSKHGGNAHASEQPEQPDQPEQPEQRE